MIGRVVSIHKLASIHLSLNEERYLVVQPRADAIDSDTDTQVNHQMDPAHSTSLIHHFVYKRVVALTTTYLALLILLPLRAFLHFLILLVHLRPI